MGSYSTVDNRSNCSSKVVIKHQNISGFLRTRRLLLPKHLLFSSTQIAQASDLAAYLRTASSASKRTGLETWLIATTTPQQSRREHWVRHALEICSLALLEESRRGHLNYCIVLVSDKKDRRIELRDNPKWPEGRMSLSHL